jgi:RecB family endonuclease NucS
MGEENTLGEECVLDKRYRGRLETAFAESDKVVLLEIGTEVFLHLKEFFYQCSFRKDFLMLETTMRRSFIIKKNMRL